MKEFFKSFFAALLAQVVGGGCLIFFFFAGIFSLIVGVASWGSGLSGKKNIPTELKASTILKIDVSSLSDIVKEDPFASFASTNSTQPIALSKITQAIRAAKNNPNIEAIYLNVEHIACGMGSIDELRRAILDFKQSKKPVWAYADNYTQKAYYLASVADKVYLNPQGIVSLTGIASSTMMYKDALDKLGVKMEVFKVGTFKSAVEPYILNRMSEANKTQVQEYIGGLWANILSGISETRKVPIDSLEQFVNNGKAYSEAETFVSFGLVDSLLYRKDIKSLFASKLGFSESDLRMISLANMAEYIESDEQSDNKIKVIFAEGEIADVSIDYWNTDNSYINYSLVKEIEDAEKDDNIHAVVLRVNSPGGSAFLSEQIWYAVKTLRAKKPVVVSMGDYAASGGYYISAPANMIVAEPNTLTGSIGIFGLVPNASALADKVGVYTDIVKTSEFADLEAGIPFRPMNDQQRLLIQKQVERGYETFLSRVSEGRQMTRDAVDQVAQGRVWLGQKALQLGLVDKLGGLQTAIQEAAKIAKLKDYEVSYGETSKNIFMELFESSNPTDDFIAHLRGSMLTKDERKMLKELRGITTYMGIQARLPYEFVSY